VEDTAELDRALESGRLAFEHAARAERYQSDPGNDTSSDPEGGAGDSESSSSFSFQPKSRAGSHSPQLRASPAAGKLNDALHGADFSPKRPHSALDHYKSGYRSAAQAAEREKRVAAALSRTNPQQQQQQQGAFPSNNARTRPQQQQRAGTDAIAARLPDMTGLTSAVETPAKASRRYLHVKQSSTGGMPLCSTAIISTDTLYHSERCPSYC
jgi:hypothetical protein